MVLRIVGKEGEKLGEREMAGEDEQGLRRRSGVPEHVSWGCSARLGRAGWAGGVARAGPSSAGSPRGRGRDVGPGALPGPKESWVAQLGGPAGAGAGQGWAARTVEQGGGGVA